MTKIFEKLNELLKTFVAESRSGFSEINMDETDGLFTSVANLWKENPGDLIADNYKEFLSQGQPVLVLATIRGVTNIAMSCLPASTAELEDLLLEAVCQTVVDSGTFFAMSFLIPCAARKMDNGETSNSKECREWLEGAHIYDKLLIATCCVGDKAQGHSNLYSLDEEDSKLNIRLLGENLITTQMHGFGMLETINHVMYETNCAGIRAMIAQSKMVC